MIEIRRYPIRPGRRPEWVRYMDEVIIPFQQDRGMRILGTYEEVDNTDGYLWLREFSDEVERERLYALVYQDPEWQGPIRDAVLELVDVDGISVTLVRPTTAPASRGESV